jgi:glycosyltransferase involved in cell wall biosynthesis
MDRKNEIISEYKDWDTLVSIIIPCYNSSKFISQTIESVLNQTHQNWEMIIVDDCSTDNSVRILTEYIKNDERIKLIKLEKNSGPAIARNRATEEAKGRYIAFLDSDDVWLPKKLEIQLKFMSKNKVSLCYSSYYLIDETGIETGLFITKEKSNYDKLLKSNFIGNLTAIYDTEYLGKQYTNNVRRQDYALWLKILKRIDEANGILEPLAKYRIHNKSISANKIKAASWQWNIYRNVEKLNLIKSMYYFMHYAYYGLFKYK